MSIWLPGVPRDESIRGAGGGSFAGGPDKIVLHTTEGGWDSSMSVFRSRLTAPHVMAAPPSHPDGPRIVQFIPLDRSGYALRNDAGGAETNRDQVLQVEIVWYAARARELTGRDLDWLGREVVGPLIEHADGDIRLTAPTFYGPDAGWTLASSSARQRMSTTEWDNFNGVCGHQHVPENDHWDPGAIDIDRILAAASGVDWDAIANYLQEDTMVIYTIHGRPAIAAGAGTPGVVEGTVPAHRSAGVKVVELPNTAAGRAVYDRVRRENLPLAQRVFRTRAA